MRRAGATLTYPVTGGSVVRVHPQDERGCRRGRRRVGHGAAVLVLVVLASWPSAAAAEGDLEAVLKPVSTSLEAGKAYLVGFTVRYPCGPSRTIQLEASGPEWAESAVTPNFRTRSERCMEGFRGEYSESILVDVYQDAVEGTAGNLSFTATDGNASVTTTVLLKVRQVTPRADVRSPDAPFVVVAGDPLTFNLTTTYTTWKPGRIRWVAEGPEGWQIAVPPARATDQGEDLQVVGSFAITSPETANGTAAFEIHAVLVNRTGARIVESTVTHVLVDAIPLVPEDEPVDGAGEPAADEPKTVPPRAPLWVVGGVVLIAMVGIYALESREERRKP